jgi:hypothetical protein
MADPRDQEDKHDAQPPEATPAKGRPDHALSGGGSDTRAGSEEGGSAYGDDREDDEAAVRQETLGGLKDAAATGAEAAEEAKSFTDPAGEEPSATVSVPHPGQPRPIKNRESIEATPGDDVDAASG